MRKIRKIFAREKVLDRDLETTVEYQEEVEMSARDMTEDKMRSRIHRL